MRDQTTSNREAELTAPTRIGSGDWLGVTDSWWIMVNVQCFLLKLLKRLNQRRNIVWVNMHNALTLTHPRLLDADIPFLAGINVCSVSWFNSHNNNLQ
jgi:hypothetical protein